MHRGAATDLFGQGSDLVRFDEPEARQQLGAVNAEVGCGNAKLSAVISVPLSNWS